MGAGAGGISLGGLPSPQGGVVARERVTRNLDLLTSAHRVVLVTAPSGYGKTVAVREWAARQSAPLAWVSLTSFDSDSARAGRLIVRGLKRTMSREGDSAGALAALDPEAADHEALARSLVRAVEELDRTVTLVVDDAYRANPTSERGFLDVLVHEGGERLRLVLATSERVDIDSERLELAGAVARLGSDELAFDAEDIRSVAAASNVFLSPDDAESVRVATSGWPAAVRILILGSGGDGSRILSAFEHGSGDRLIAFVGEVLERLPADLAEFIEATTTTAETTAELASAISGQGDAGRLLDECADRGIFLERFHALTPRPSYRWHPVFASAVQARLRRRDLERSRALHASAARALVSSDPIRAFHEALHADDGELAFRLLTSSWLYLLLCHGEARAVERMCSSLPEPWRDDAQTVMIRACCRDFVGQRDEGQRLLASVDLWRPPEGAPPSARRTHAVAHLMLSDERRILLRAIEAIYTDLSSPDAPHGRNRLALLLVVGLSRAWLRVVDSRTLETLSSTVDLALAMGDDAVARRASGILSMALAFGGRFAESDRIRTRSAGFGEADESSSYIGGAEDTAAGYVAYFQNRLDDAKRHFRRVVASGSGPMSFGSIARKYFALAVAASGDKAGRVEARDMLESLPEKDAHGVPWSAYRMICLAKLAEADGRLGRARQLAQRFGTVEHLPSVAVILAELLRRTGDERRALTTIEQIRPHFRLPYIRAAALTTLALIHRGHGRAELAHQTLEEALDAAEPHDIGRPFSDPDPDLTALLAEHLSWGSAHEAYLSTVSARGVRRQPNAALSERETEILGLLRTQMTIQEIAARLGISVNTAKTHLRGVYRKLDVASRREAVRASF